MKKAADYQHRWQVYRKQHEELVERKREIMDNLARGVCYLTLKTAKDMVNMLLARFNERCEARDREMRRIVARKKITLLYNKVMRFHGMTVKVRAKR